MSLSSLGISLLASASLPVLAQQPVAVAVAAAQPLDEGGLEENGEEIVVQGQKPRGSVVGDIPPENVLDARDIRATGATSISELISSVASQTGSARGRGGGRPVLLLNGQRISGFRELRDLPPEAIERMEVLPEEVALKYGYAADQRVINIVLRRRFNSTSVELRGRGATDGGHVAGHAEAGRLLIDNGSRTAINLRVEGNSPLYESERNLLLQPIPSQPDTADPRPFRTLVGAANSERLNATHNRTILEDVSATINGEIERSASKARLGIPTATLVGGGETILRAFPEEGSLRRDSRTEAVRLGSSLNWSEGKWRLSSTGNAELTRSRTRTENGPDIAPVQARLDSGDPTLDPLGDLGSLAALPADRSRSRRHSAALDGTATGPLLALPAGEVTATMKLSAGTTGIDSSALVDGVASGANLDRTTLSASANIDVPLARRTAAIGRLSANANAALFELSDFGTLTTLGAGLNWAPAQRISLNASWTREEGAPSLQQLGDPLVATPGVAFFDYKTGRTALVTTISGGNRQLRADTRNVFKIGGNWQPLEETDLRLRAEYVRQTIDDPQASFPAASEALEAAFPGRFERDLEGNLLRVDLRPVNFERARRDTLRWGFDFTKPLQSRPPSAAAIAAFRERFAAQAGQAGRPGGAPGGGSGGGGPRAEGGAGQAPASAPPSGGGTGPGPGGFRFGGPGGMRGGRLSFSLTHQVNLVDEVRIAKGIEPLDYLDGEPIGITGGRPSHEIQFEAGYFNNGQGVRLQGNWRSASTVESSRGDLRFAPYFDLDLRLFANLGENFELVSRRPFFRGTSIRFDVDNILNTRPKVRDSVGLTPFSYQPDLIEPVGRTFALTFRKLFVPRRFIQQVIRQRPAG